MKLNRWLFLVGWVATTIHAWAQVATTPPKALRRSAPEYPAALKAQRVVGSANLSFLVDVNGDVKEVRVEHAAQEAFGRAAAAAVSQWKYQPATKAGQPVALRVGMSLEFSLTGAELARLEEVREKEALPPGPAPLEVAELDEWPELKKEIRPKTPPVLQAQRRMGQAIMAFVVDEQGVPRDIHPVVVTHVECGVEAAVAIAQWRFEPGRKAGQAVRVAMELPMVFFPESTSSSGLRVKPGVKRGSPPGDVLGVDRSDIVMPTPLKRVAPDYPDEMADRHSEGIVNVDIVIDSRGRVTHVLSVGESNAFFATVAERAVSHWRFKPATVNGIPVACRVCQPINFYLTY